MEPILLTQYSRGAGCGCKIAPKQLEEILAGQTAGAFEKLLVGNSGNDDAAVYDIGNGQALISTVDFFMPVVDDAFDFGRIAAANAISDIYAMGGKPLIATAVLGWPIEKIPAELARQVIEGGRKICEEAGIPLAGGHSVDSAEPFFGLSVNGLIEITALKKNNGAKEGDIIFLTKPLGTGILSTAQKRGLINNEHVAPMIEQMTSLNKIGEELGKLESVHAMTDVTGFGLAGHLVEMADGSNLTAEISYENIRLMNGVKEYVSQRIFPDATSRNWNGYSAKIKFEKGVNVMEAFSILPDPQTNGGLLVSVDPKEADKMYEMLGQPIGRFVERQEKAIIVR